MNAKKANLLYLIMFSVYVGSAFFRNYLDAIFPDVIMNSWGQLVIVVPTLLFVFSSPKPFKTLRFRKIKVTNLLLLIVALLMMYPLIVSANLFTQIYVSNAASEAMTTLSGSGFLKSFLAIAIMAPLCEELGFRGGIYGGYTREYASIQAVIVSSLIFGIFHLNYNQAPYAFFLAVFICLANEATGSIFAGMFIHFLVNGSNYVLAYVTSTQLNKNPQMADAVATQVNEISGKVLASYAGKMLAISVVTVPIAICILQFVAKRAGRENALSEIWKNRKKGWSIFTIILYIALILNVGFLIYLNC